MLLALFVFCLPAQTAAELESIIQTPAVTCDLAARFVLASSESQAAIGSSGSAESETPATSFELAVENGWFPQGTSADDTITLGKLSYLMMEAFEMRGGLMYALFPGPRYAFRCMVSRSLIQGAADPGMTVSGERFLHILGRVLSATGGE